MRLSSDAAPSIGPWESNRLFSHSVDEIIQSCKAIVCWITVKGEDDNDVRLFSTDYAFFIPKDSVDRKVAFLFGDAIHDTISINLQKHLLRNVGASFEEIIGVKEPAFELTVEAAGAISADDPRGAPMADDAN